MTDPAPPAQDPPPIGVAKMVVLVLFALGVLAIPVVVIAGAVGGFDALWFALGIAAGCLILVGVWTYALDTARWIGATSRLVRTRGLTGTRLPSAADSAPTTPAVVADDDRRLDRRRVTRLVAEAQRKSPGLKKRPDPDGD